MSMQTYYITQLTEIFCAYFLVTLVFPWIALYKQLDGQRLVKQVMFCYLVGNYYVMNLVFLLELLHISCRATLILGTVIPYLLYANHFNEWHLRSRLLESLTNLQKLLGKRIGKKTLRMKRREQLTELFQKIRKYWNKTTFLMKIDFLIFLVSFVAVIYYYGIAIVGIYGYSASDLPVHNYWINALSNNQLFVAGIYPEGAHCVEYYLHAVFGFDTYVILSQFGFIQITCVAYMSLFMLKLCCKNRFLPYIGFAIYMCTNIWSACTYSRFYNSLPQEYGMIFILPAIYFGFEFFELQYQERKEWSAENKRESRSKKRSDRKLKKDRRLKNVNRESRNADKQVNKKTEWQKLDAMQKTERRENRKKKWLSRKEYCVEFMKKPYFSSLCGFCMSFGMTFMVHFYNSIILCLCCVAIAIGYFGLFIKKEFFKKIVATCAISLLIALSPMVIMFATGTPLQGSLGWGLSVIFGSSEEEEEDTEDDQAESLDETIETDNDQYDVTETENQSDEVTVTITATDEKISAYSIDNTSADQQWSYSEVSPKRNLIQILKEKNEIIRNGVNTYIFNNSHAEYYDYILMAVGVLMITGLIFHFMRRRCLGCMLWATAFAQIILLIALTADSIGIPRLMDPSRASIYNAYFIPVTLVIAIDSILAIPTVLMSRFFSVALDVIGIMALGSVLFLIYDDGFLRTQSSHGFLETNEAVTCLTNIIRTQEDDTWTILSANDETQMGTDHGYHYETLTLLHKIEVLKDHEPVYIPTEKIFVFIEKEPLNYMGGFLGKTISEEYAQMDIPMSYLGLGAYEGDNRMICMSRLYYWMQAFIQTYPEAVQVYFEDDIFVCYEITQNTYRQYDLAIDYGFNTD